MHALLPAQGFLGGSPVGLHRRSRLNHKRLLIGEIRDKTRARLDNFTELEYSDIVTTLALVSREELAGQKDAEVFLFTDLIENSPFMPGGEFLMLPNEALLKRIADNQLVPAARRQGPCLRRRSRRHGGAGGAAGRTAEQDHRLLDQAFQGRRIGERRDQPESGGPVAFSRTSAAKVRCPAIEPMARSDDLECNGAVAAAKMIDQGRRVGAIRIGPAGNR